MPAQQRADSLKPYKRIDKRTRCRYFAQQRTSTRAEIGVLLLVEDGTVREPLDNKSIAPAVVSVLGNRRIHKGCMMTPERV
jgi:hypothetical protein